MRQLVRLGRAISDWPVASQQVARRNAMIALTACAQRRAERDEVESYLAERTRRDDVVAPAVPAADPEVAVQG